MSPPSPGRKARQTSQLDAAGWEDSPAVEAPTSGSLELATANSLTVAFWTVVARIAGLGRVVAIAAILGPTFLGNIFQATTVLPLLVYELFAGSLFMQLLVPPLVRHIDVKDSSASARLAGGFLGAAMVGFGLVSVLAIVAAPAVLHVFTLGVEDSATASDQRNVGWLLMAMMMPQLLLYAIAGTAIAVQNACGRFALAAAAPALENIAVVALLIVAGAVFGTGVSLETVETAELLLLGLGTTTAVALSAGAQWFGAWRAGVRLVPRAGWRDPEVRPLLARGVPSLGNAALRSVRIFAGVVVANRIPGGVVAFQIALNFFLLPLTVCARPIGVAFLPRLSRLYHDYALRPFRDELAGATSLVLFLTVPATVSLVVLAEPLAAAVSFGAMATSTGESLVSVAIAALAVGVVGESTLHIATNASYALHDARAPFKAMLTGTAIAIAGMTIAFFLPAGTAVLAALGLAISAGAVASMIQLERYLRAQLPTNGTSIVPSLLRTISASALMALPAYFVAEVLSRSAGGEVGDVVTALGASVVGLITFFAFQRALHAPELTLLLGGYRRLRVGNDG